MRYAILLVSLSLLAGCETFQKLKIDPCAILPDMKTCFAVPINQPEKPEYERSLESGDICVTPEEYVALAENYKEALRRCGKNCK